MKAMSDQDLQVFLVEQIDNALSSWAARWISQDNKDIMVAEKRLFLSNMDTVHKLNQALQEQRRGTVP